MHGRRAHRLLRELEDRLWALAPPGRLSLNIKPTRDTPELLLELIHNCHALLPALSPDLEGAIKISSVKPA
ncbi:hypothetical protein GCM10022419_136190 [Nonomuraea rosea]|uniref:Uncharacterized protein n=1 Tax=Nonomuraea rosea TaxID=638574 RepID=A0ABP7AA00_9ACTN